MKLILSVLLFICAMSINIQAQNDSKSLDDYVNNGKTILIAKCLSVGAVNIIGETGSTMQVLHILKGKETTGEVRVTTKGFTMRAEVGKTYLLRSEVEPKDGAGNPYFRIETFDSMVTLAEWTDIEELKKLSVKFAVARIMYTRKDEVERKIEHLTYEKQALEKILKEQ